MFTYGSSEATNENQIGPSFQFLRASFTMSCGLHDSAVAVDRFLFGGRSLLRFAGPATVGMPLLLSWTSALCPFSSVMVLFVLISASPEQDGSALTWEGPCKFALENLLLFAASTRVFKGFHKSTFPSRPSLLFSKCSPRFWSFENLTEELCR